MSGVIYWERANEAGTRVRLSYDADHEGRVVLMADALDDLLAVSGWVRVFPGETPLGAEAG